MVEYMPEYLLAIFEHDQNTYRISLEASVRSHVSANAPKRGELHGAALREAVHSALAEARRKLGITKVHRRRITGKATNMLEQTIH